MKKYIAVLIASMSFGFSMAHAQTSGHYVKVPLPAGNSDAGKEGQDGEGGGFSLAPNGVTVLCHGVQPGTTGVVNGKSYTAYDDSNFQDLINARNDLLLESACTSSVTDMWSALSFYEGNPDITHWDTSNVVYMDNLFESASNFNRPIGVWNTSKVVSMNSMFLNAASFNQPLAAWNVSSVDNMGSMFQGATSFNQNISNWNTSNVRVMSLMFAHSAYNQPIGSWSTSNVELMNGMFYMNGAFNQAIGGWNVSSVRNMNRMFAHAVAFNQPIGGWDVTGVVEKEELTPGFVLFEGMKELFNGATSFKQNIGCWNVQRFSAMPSKFMTGTTMTGDDAPKWGMPPASGC